LALEDPSWFKGHLQFILISESTVANNILFIPSPDSVSWRMNKWAEVSHPHENLDSGGLKKKQHHHKILLHHNLDKK
jgi:hypothetical protein